MALSRPNPDDDAINGVVIGYEKNIPYLTASPAKLPEPPSSEIRPSGFFGRGANRQDVDYANRMRKIYLLAQAAAFAEKTGAMLEVKTIQDITVAVQEAEKVAFSIHPDSVASLLATDMVSEMIARRRLNHRTVAETFDSTALDTISRR